MNPRKTFVLAFIFTFLAGIFLFTPNNAFTKPASPVALVVTADKTEYQKGDDILVKFKLVNNGTEPVYVCKRFRMNGEASAPDTRDIYLTVTSASGTKLECKANSEETGVPRSDDFVLLKGGEESAAERDRNIKYYFDLSAAGNYTLKAVYENLYGEELGLAAFKGKIESAPVAIKIKEETAPAAQEQAKGQK